MHRFTHGLRKRSKWADLPVKFVNLIRQHLRTMEKNSRVAYLARLLWGSTDGWGKEVLGSTDCSGSVCWALWLMGFEIRTTAHVLESTATKSATGLPDPGNLVFWWGLGTKLTTVVHVAIFSDKMLIMNASNRFVDIPLSQEIEKRKGHRYEVKQIDWAAVKAMSDSKKHAFGVDEEIRPLLGLFDV